jgi:large subunit ribosomal protein L37Ae
VADLEEKSKASYDCPSCNRNRVKRISTAIWSCCKCGYTFAGGSFLPETSLGRSMIRSLKKTLEAA